MSDPKKSGNFAKPRKIAKKICQPRKIGFGQISNPKNRTSIPVKILTCAPPPPPPGDSMMQTLMCRGNFEKFFRMQLYYSMLHLLGVPPEFKNTTFASTCQMVRILIAGDSLTPKSPKRKTGRK